MPRKRRITEKEQQRRARISRSLRAYHRGVRAAKQRRSLAAKRGALTKAAKRELHRLQQMKEVAPKRLEFGYQREQVQEWEVTVKYTVGKGKHHGEVVDVTLRLVGRPGEAFSNAQVRAAAWYALKHGADSLTGFTLEAIDWYNRRRSGATEEYHYAGSERGAAMDNARGIFYKVGLGGLRVALVE